jgi:uncharacterized protein Yka (UPF0111/DUF47 family)
VARLKLIPQKREFYELYNQSAANTVAISDRLVELLDRFPEGADELMGAVKDLEHEGDRLTHELVDLLNRNFVTPFDRDDMYRLAGALDDICDHIDEAAGRVVSYGVGEIRLQAREQAKVIRSSAGKLADAVALLEGFQDSRTWATGSCTTASRASSWRAPTRSRSSAGRTSTRASRRPWTPAGTPPTCSRPSS